MACSISNMNMTLPRVRTVLPGESPSSSPILLGRNLFTTNSSKKDDHDSHFAPRLELPLGSPKELDTYVRRESTCSTSSAPSLSYSNSPSPSPPPTRPSSPETFFLVPCAMHLADAVVLIPEPTTPKESREDSDGESLSRPASPVFRPCKPSEARAMLLIGPAISTHARRKAARLHPYRIVRDRRS
ncbi:hypothetical protein M422DRAFT_782236 [Sphaerobolus stellatus SS14]|uniref:Uncharacterized protein n=1 Tax=Sphaerobolus stellatus (strain SS14) TaxID=990650 RepID=A0A0C9UN68_SPHS4|nr:hypothetical protein M422DRAFT_782236 [Sphaerobolus stellatus SS14]